MGVGGDNSWTPATHKEYLVAPGVFRVAVVVAGVGEGEDAGRVWAEVTGEKGGARV